MGSLDRKGETDRNWSRILKIDRRDSIVPPPDAFSGVGPHLTVAGNTAVVAMIGAYFAGTQ